MVKTGVFKKIAALTAAVAMMASFALCASAAEVQTTTQYVNGTQEINVIASVSGAGAAAEVTYYATNGAKNVYIDQKTADEDGAVSFDYVTDAADLLKSNVLVGYTGASATATDDDIPGYTISGTGITDLNVPTENINGTHVLDYALDAGKIVTGVTAEGATVSNAIYANGKLTVTLAGATGNVVLSVATEDAATHNPSIDFVDAALIVSDGTADEVIEVLEGDGDNTVKAGDRKLSVLACVTDATEYGVLVSTEAIEDSVVVGALDENIAFRALGANDSGFFAVQLIDTDADTSEAMLQTGVKYYTAVYYKHPDTNTYYITAGETVEIAAE